MYLAIVRGIMLLSVGGLENTLLYFRHCKLHCTLLHSTKLHCTLLYCTVLNYTGLTYTALHRNALY